MKRIIFIMAAVLAFACTSSAGEDRPVSFDKLPVAAREFIQTNFSGEKVALVTRDRDVVSTDYEVTFVSGIKLEFSSKGEVKKIESKVDGIDGKLIPEAIRSYVDDHFPGCKYLEYSVDSRGYEVELSNRMELKFNRNFELVEIES